MFVVCLTCCLEHFQVGLEVTDSCILVGLVPSSQEHTVTHTIAVASVLAHLFPLALYPLYVVLG